MNRVMELVQELTKVEARRDELRTELGGLLGFGAAPTAVATTKVSKPATQRTVRVPGEDGAEKTQPSMKQVVQAIVAKHPDGVELRAIVDEVTEMVKRNE